ncbi:MAG TPA: kelch repeat-containing protein [Terriglobales bacterium]|nr:kelch repeat-containing protein [Terriglobales bacterium]
MKSDPSKSGSAVVTVPAFISLSPSSETLGPKGMRQFVAGVTDPNQAVTWSVEEGAAGGSITANGLYTVPDHLGTFHVVATSVAHPAKSASATVFVVASGFGLSSSMSTARTNHSATLLMDGKVLITGGRDIVGNGLATAELFDPATETFSSTGSLHTTRAFHSATLLANGKVLIVGGVGPCSDYCRELSTAEIYDPLTGTFSATGSMALGRAGQTATLLADGKVLVTGGGGFGALSSAELYDPATGKFTSAGNMLSARENHTATLLGDGKVLIVGGWNGFAADAPDDPPWDPLFGELFDDASRSFVRTGSMSTTRMGHSATRLLNGKVLVLGGIPIIQNIHEQPPSPRQAELYDANSQSFSATANPVTSRSSHTATLLSSGKVLIAGGAHSGRTIGSAELYDPGAATFNATGGLVTERIGHTATLLRDGRVLVTGGTDKNGKVLDSAEVYK